MSDILTDSEIAEIEARTPVSYWTFKGNFAGQFVPLTGMDRDELCRSHRSLVNSLQARTNERDKLLQSSLVTEPAQAMRIDELESRIRTLESACEAALMKLQDNDRWWGELSSVLPDATEFYKQSFRARSETNRKVIEQLEGAING